MGFLTTVKRTVLGDDAEVGREDAGAPGTTDASAESADAGRPGDVTRPAEACSSEADFVVATGRSRADALVELVEAHGGRVKQSELVERTGWSKATVSRYLGQLEEEGAIHRTPVGRHKVVMLPDESVFEESLLDEPREPEDASASDSGYPRT